MATKQRAKSESKAGTIGWITHTDIQSTDPAATQQWAEEALGWEFAKPTKSESGDEYLLFHYSSKGGGGIARVQTGKEPPGVTPFVHVEDCQEAFDLAVEAGAEAVSEPMTMGEVTIARVRAPGGVVIGLSSGE